MPGSPIEYTGDKKRPTGGYSVELKTLEVKDQKLVVHWKLKSPGPPASPKK